MPIICTPFEPSTEGVFDIPPELYHNHKAAPEVSRSLLVDLMTVCPKYAKALIDGSVKKTVTKEMKSGTFVDMALMEPDKFREGVSHWVLPEGLNLTTKEGRQWKKDHPDLPVIKATSDSPNEASVEDIRGMIESVMADRRMRRVVEESQKQESFFCHHGHTGILRKCRLDMRLSDNFQRMTIVDLKSTGPKGTLLHKFAAKCGQQNYHAQDAFYSSICQDLTGERPHFLFCVVERKPPYLVRLFQISDKGKHAASEQCNRGLEIYAQCKDSGIWPGHREEIEIVELPRWALEAPEAVNVDLSEL